jgi:hypothetical protein
MMTDPLDNLFYLRTILVGVFVHSCWKDLNVLVAWVHSGVFVGPTVQRVIEY